MRDRTRISLALVVAALIHGGGALWGLRVGLPPPVVTAQVPVELRIERVPREEPPRPRAPKPPPVAAPRPLPKEKPPPTPPPPAPPRREKQRDDDGQEPPRAAAKAPAPREPASPPSAPAEVPTPRRVTLPSAPAVRAMEHTEHRLVRKPDGRLEHDATRFKAEIQKDGSVRFEDKPDFEVFGEGMPLGTARFDLNDALWRLLKRDPYLYQKRAFLKDTEALRDAQALAHAAQMLGPALDALAASLEKLLADRTLSAAAKRAAVHELWDDCNDEDSGRAARAIIEGFVRARMPRGSPRGFSDEDLARLNEGAPRASRFSPYEPAGGASG